MIDAGVTPPPDIVADGKIHRFDIEGDKPRTKNGWYTLFPDDPPAGAFGDWKRDIQQTWSAKEYQTLSPEEQTRYRANMEAARRAREQEQERMHAECRKECTAIWEQSEPAPADHPYLVAKGVKPHGLRLYKGALLVPIRDGSTLHGLQFIGADGEKRFKSGTDKRGHYYSIGGRPTKVLYLAEGYATAASIYEATGEPVAVCFDAGNLHPVLSALRKKMPKIQMVICADNDRNGDTNTGVIRATQAAQAEGALLAIPQFPEGVSGSDYNDLAQACGLDEVRRQVEACAEPISEDDTATKDEKHSEPLPLPAELLPVEPFDYDLLPGSFRPWVQDMCERMQCPPDFVAVAVMTALGSLIGRRLGVRPQNKTTWTAIPNMWGIVIGKPGVMKSPALSEALKPLNRLAAQAMSEFKDAEKEHKVEAAKADAVIAANDKKIKGMAADASKVSELTELVEQNEGLKEQRDSLPTPKRYIANDSSYQALGELLRHNPNGVLVFRDELVSLIKGLDREDQSEARGFYLEGWNGDGDYTFDRIGRGMNLYIPSLCISMLGGTQPGKISEYVRHAVKGGTGDDGLIQRFGLMVWPDINGKWKNIDRYPDTQAKNRAFEVFERLDSMQPEDVGAEQDTNVDGEPDGTPYLRLAPEAQAVFLQWRESLEDRIRGDELPDPLANHFAKYRKLIPSLALILHLAAGGTGPVSETATIKALAWSEYLDSHAQRVYGSLTHHEVGAAKAILRKIKQGKLDSAGFSSRDVWRPQWSKLTDREQVIKALNLLVDYQWLNFTEQKDTGGRTATLYTLNPEARI
jgi:putative DNA primase/helicase